MAKTAIATLLLLLSGCAGTIGLAQNPSQFSGTAAGLFGLPAATVAEQLSAELSQIQMIAAQLQMLKAQLDGSLPIIQTPPIVSPQPTPTMPSPSPSTGMPSSVPSTFPSSPAVTPNVVAPRRHVVLPDPVVGSLWDSLADAR